MNRKYILQLLLYTASGVFFTLAYLNGWLIGLDMDMAGHTDRRATDFPVLLGTMLTGIAAGFGVMLIFTFYRSGFVLHLLAAAVGLLFCVMVHVELTAEAGFMDIAQYVRGQIQYDRGFYFLLLGSGTLLTGSILGVLDTG